MAVIAAHRNARVILVVTVWRQEYESPFPQPPFARP